MTEKKQQQAETKARAKVTELKDEQLDQASGGVIDGSSNTRTVKSIRDGTSN